MKCLPVILIFTAMALAPAYGQEAIGRAATVKPQAKGTVAGTLSPNSSVHSNETISTEETGQAGLKFHDDSHLAVGSKSSVRLDKFVYDPHKEKDKWLSTQPKDLSGSALVHKGEQRAPSSRPMARLAFEDDYRCSGGAVGQSGL